jgi:hypothetical protein
MKTGDCLAYYCSGQGSVPSAAQPLATCDGDALELVGDHKGLSQSRILQNFLATTGHRAQRTKMQSVDDAEQAPQMPS